VRNKEGRQSVRSCSACRVPLYEGRQQSRVEEGEG
jgi:hypothetical protein